jgi:hypothetical protein
MLVPRFIRGVARNIGVCIFILSSAITSDLIQSARNYATTPPTAAFAGQKGNNVRFPLKNVVQSSFRLVSLGKIHCHADSRRWCPSQIIPCFFDELLVGIGPEISQSVKGIYAAAKVNYFLSAEICFK